MHRFLVPVLAVGFGLGSAVVQVPPADAAAKTEKRGTAPDPARDKRCARGANQVLQRKGTLRAVRTANRRSAGVCDTRYGVTVVVPTRGRQRFDAAATIEERSGDFAVVTTFRASSRTPSLPTTVLVDVRRSRVDVLADEAGAVLRPDGSALFAKAADTRSLTIAARNGRRDVLARVPAFGSIVVRGSRVTFGSSSGRVTVDIPAQLARLRTCQPGPTGTAAAQIVRPPQSELGIWVLDGITRACPTNPTGELRLPCDPSPATPATSRRGSLDAAGTRLADHCLGTPDVVHVIDTVSRRTIAIHPLGGSNLESQIAVSLEGFVAFGTRIDGAPGPLVNAVQVTGPDGLGPRTVGQAGLLVRNVRFTAPRTLQWTARDREGGPAEGQTAGL